MSWNYGRRLMALDILGHVPTLTEWALRYGALAYNPLTAGSSIEPNAAYTGGVGDELITSENAASDNAGEVDATAGFTTAGGSVTLSSQSVEKIVGNFAIEMEAVDGASDRGEYDITLTAGDTYRYQFYAKGDNIPQQAAHQWVGFTGFTTQLFTAEWVQYTGDHICSAASAKMRFYASLAGSAGDKVWVDDLRLAKVSELDLAVAGTTTPVAGYQGQRAGTLGATVVTNGGFDTDSDWSKGTGWTIGSGVASKAAGTGSDLTQAAILTTGQSYKLVFTVSNYSAGTLTAKLGSSGASLAITANGTYTLDGVANGADLIFTADASFAGDVDDVSAKPFSTTHALYLDGATSELKQQGPKVDGLSAKTIAMQFYGFTLTSKTLLKKTDELDVTVTAGDKIAVTQHRATVDATLTTDTSIVEYQWNTLIITISPAGTIEVWINGTKDTATPTTGSGAFVSNTNAAYYGGEASGTNAIDGVLDDALIDDRVWTDTEIQNWHNRWQPA